MKQVYYFSHDFHARKDPKCIALIQDFGMTGYGLYWCLIEMMYEQGGMIKKFPALFPALSKELKLPERTLTKIIEAMVHKYELLIDSENFLFSNAVLSRLEIREWKKSARQEAGRIGGLKSGAKRSKTKQNEALLQANEANEPKEPKEKKGNEIKGNKNKGERSDLAPPSDFVCYDAEAELIKNRIQFEKICISTGAEETAAKNELHLYHLWLTKKESYPMGRLAVYAGFESWLLTGKRFTKNSEKNGHANHHTTTGNSAKQRSLNALHNLIKTEQAELDALREKGS